MFVGPTGGAEVRVRVAVEVLVRVAVRDAVGVGVRLGVRVAAAVAVRLALAVMVRVSVREGLRVAVAASSGGVDPQPSWLGVYEQSVQSLRRIMHGAAYGLQYSQFPLIGPP